MSRFDRYDRERPPTDVASALAQAPARTRYIPHPVAPDPNAPIRAGVICNPISHQNLRAQIAHQVPTPDVVLSAPRTHGELAATLTEFAARGIGLLVIDGGDGTVRDVLTAAAEAFGGDLPQIAILPNGKTNALAHDLGLPHDWTLDQALAAAATGGLRRRAPIVVERERASLPPLHGFLVGAGGFVRATELAQRTHKAGAFHDLAVGLVVVWSVLKTLFGGPKSGWRAGDPMRIVADDETLSDGQTFFVFGSTLETFPLGLKPLGPVRAGFKLLVVPAAARRMWLAIGGILTGRRGGWLERWGYHLRDVKRATGSIVGGFILDGDHFDDGRVQLHEGPPIAFVVP